MLRQRLLAEPIDGLIRTWAFCDGRFYFAGATAGPPAAEAQNEEIGGGGSHEAAAVAEDEATKSAGPSPPATA